MKRFLLFISLIFTSLFMACNITVEDTSLLKAPDVETTSSGIGIRLSVLNSDTNYINIYRIDVTDNTKNENAVNIGMIFPKVIGITNSSYFYEDLNVYQGHKYKYYARYKDDSDTYLTNESAVIKSNTGYPATARLKYGTNSVRFIFNEKNQTLRIHGNIKDPEINNFADEYVPVISVKCDDKSQVFELGSISDDEDINLRGILSSEFMDKEIQILGLLGQKKEIQENDKLTEIKSQQIKKIIWTEPAEIDIAGYNNGKITIKSDSGTNGYDYS